MVELERDGAQLLAGAASGCMVAIRAAIEHLPLERAGTRIFGNSTLIALLEAGGVIGQQVVPFLGPKARPVRAILFNKTLQTNWPLGWHQDRTICVNERQEVEGFASWSIKQHLIHVEPPFAILENMVTLRIHIDPVFEENAPLLVALGSHRMGRIEVTNIGDVVRRLQILKCLAAGGDIWIYSTPILHASDAAEIPGQRRVLQVDYSANELPGALEWKGI